MKIKRAVASGLATVGLTAGLVLTAAPAQAAGTWGWIYDSQVDCAAGTSAKWASYVAKGYSVSITQNCEYHKTPGANYSPYWYSEIKYK